jgi:hypothetical protein
MKKLLFNSLLLSGLIIGCSKKDDPASSPSLVGTWTLTERVIVTTPKSGGASTTYPQRVVPKAATLTYTADGKYQTVFDKSVSGTGATEVNDGNYVYSGSTITYSRPGSTTSSTGRVDVLTASTLVHSATTDSGSYMSVTTNTYSR